MGNPWIFLNNNVATAKPRLCTGYQEHFLHVRNSLHSCIYLRSCDTKICFGFWAHARSVLKCGHKCHCNIKEKMFFFISIYHHFHLISWLGLLFTQRPMMIIANLKKIHVKASRPLVKESSGWSLQLYIT